MVENGSMQTEHPRTVGHIKHVCSQNARRRRVNEAVNENMKRCLSSKIKEKQQTADLNAKKLKDYQAGYI